MPPVGRSKGLPPNPLWLLVAAWIPFQWMVAAEPSSGPLRIRALPGSAEISVPGPGLSPVVGTRYKVSLERSRDLVRWGSSTNLTPLDDPSATLTAVVSLESGEFFRATSALEETGGPTDGAELFGFSRVLAPKLSGIGYPQIPKFLSLNRPTNQYLPAIQFDPTTAKYWKEFNTDPAVFNATLPPGSPDRRLHDFRLTGAELGLFRSNGFVVSERLGYSSFADAYYAVFADDFPLFVSTDSVLEAWHKSYESMLSEMEETQFVPGLIAVLEEMHTSALPQLRALVASGPLTNCVADADYVLAVARSLLTGNTVDSLLGQNDRVKVTLAAAASETFVPSFTLWNTPRPVDFSQMIVRGKYTHSVESARYFRAVKWLALANLHVAGPLGSLRELGTAVVLHDLYLRAVQNREKWDGFDQLITQFVGRTDALSFRELGPLRNAAGLDIASAMNPDRLKQFQNDLLAGKYGVQNYASEAIPVPFGVTQTQLPQEFSLFGARFILDGWATAQLTFPNVKWPEVDVVPGGTYNGRVLRRLPTGLDVALGVLGNGQLANDIADRITRTGLPYQNNLTAVRQTVDQLSLQSWRESVYSGWLYALRTLSLPTTDPRYPQAMRTRAWMHKTVNTQLASWTELRHDTILYAAQPVSGIILCEYPAGYVEPRVEFWEAMRQMAQDTADLIAKRHYQGSANISFGSGEPISVDIQYRADARRSHCLKFASVMASLAEMSRKELAGIPFTAEETALIKGTMNSQDHPYFGATYDGWYPDLFYKDIGQIKGSTDTKPAGHSPALVTDVHTAPPDDLYEGGVLHEGVGAVDLMLIAVDNGPDRMVYAGPMLSHYEFVEGPGVKRLTDGQWGSRLSGPEKPTRPEWTQDYLVPK